MNRPVETLRLRVRDRTFRHFISRDEIATMVQRIAAEIERDYAGREITMLVILKGAMVFASDLMRQIDVPITVETLRASSYREAMRTSGTVNLEDVVPDIEGRNVIIIEDIIDSGNTIRELIKRLGSYQPASVAVAALLSKPEEHGREIQIDYLGREIGSEFVVGYGLDYAGYGRQYDSIWVVTEDGDQLNT